MTTVPWITPTASIAVRTAWPVPPRPEGCRPAARPDPACAHLCAPSPSGLVASPARASPHSQLPQRVGASGTSPVCQRHELIFEYSQKTAFAQLREQAIALRRAGKSRPEIKELLGITSNETLNESLKGQPPQPWTWRPNAKDDPRAKARELRHH